LKEPQIIKQWETTEINPEEIARYLHGKLEESTDADSKWNILLYYGRKSIPVITLKLDPEKRKIFIAVHATKNTYRCVDELVGVEDLWFIQYCDPVRNTLETDIRIRVRNSGKIDAATVISSKAHRAFEYPRCKN
jgi:hypothetical protein